MLSRQSSTELCIVKASGEIRALLSRTSNAFSGCPNIYRRLTHKSSALASVEIAAAPDVLPTSPCPGPSPGQVNVAKYWMDFCLNTAVLKH
ncbi:hypothetical protein J6590_034240 [Homalodisca vitripennis]|nr:hypothetical protein J6590_034240 [Homalodisca vitripennis]